MATIRSKGKPDLITMTCNPNWREIQENLSFFQLKKKHLIK